MAFPWFEVVAIFGAASWIPQIAKIFLKPKINIKLDEIAEIGYSQLGPIFNVKLAFAVERQDAVIEFMKVDIKHEKGEHHTLSWKFLGETQFEIKSYTGTDGGIVEKTEVAIALKASTSVITQKKIGFRDNEFEDGFRSFDFKVQDRIRHEKKISEDDISSKIVTTREYGDLIDFLKSNMYWRTGSYVINLSAKALNIKAPISCEYSMQISENDSEALQNNVELIDNYIRKYLAIDPDKADDLESFPKLTWINPRLEKIK